MKIHLLVQRHLKYWTKDYIRRQLKKLKSAAEWENPNVSILWQIWNPWGKTKSPYKRWKQCNEKKATDASNIRASSSERCYLEVKRSLYRPKLSQKVDTYAVSAAPTWGQKQVLSTSRLRASWYFAHSTVDYLSDKNRWQPQGISDDVEGWSP